MAATAGTNKFETVSATKLRLCFGRIVCPRNGVCPDTNGGGGGGARVAAACPAACPASCGGCGVLGFTTFFFSFCSSNNFLISFSSS